MVRYVINLTRRKRLIVNAPSALKIITVLLLLALGIRWVVTHNHDADYGPGPAPRPMMKLDDRRIDWTKFKYVQFVTTPEDLCSSVMIYTEMEMIGSLAERMLVYPSNWDVEEVNTTDPSPGPTPMARLLQSAREDGKAILHPLDSLNENITSPSSWTNPAYTKLLAFNLTDYSRVLVLDPASVVLGNIDKPFLLPAAPIAMPFTYFGVSTGWAFSPHMMLVEPSSSTFHTIFTTVKDAGTASNDMKILHTLFPSKIMRMAHKLYGLLTLEFRHPSHFEFLGSIKAKWDPEKILSKARFLHFSDYPLPKPWIRAPQDLINKYMPGCVKSEWFGASDCRDREVWFKLYADFENYRNGICKIGV